MRGGLNVKAIVVAVSVLVAACGGGGADKAATTGDTQPGEETTTLPPGADAEAQAGGGEVSAGGGAAAGGTATTKPGAAASSGSSGGTSSGGGGGSTATATPGKGGSAVAAGKSAKAGRYTFNRTGKRTIPGIGDQSLNGPGTLTVDPPTGSDQRTFLSYNQYDSTEQTVRYGADRVELVHLKLETQAGTFEFRPSPPVLFAPDPVKVGATWAWKMTSTDNRLTLDSTFKAVRTENQSVGGESVATSVVEGTINLSGFLTGTIRQTLWASDRYRLIVRLDETSDLSGVQSQSSSVLASTNPA
ncbi:MAG: hypothetical protein KY443_09890 [Actinobacteria bacterium]|nr:hypothetical protein [Actinomycetota bacterium]